MSTVRYYLLGAYTSLSSNPLNLIIPSPDVDMDRTDFFVENDIWINGYTNKFSDVVNRVGIGDLVAIKSSNRNQGTMTIKAIGLVNENLEDGRTLGVNWNLDFEPFDVPFGGGKYTHTICEVTNQDHIDQIWDHQPTEAPIIKIQRFGETPDVTSDLNQLQKQFWSGLKQFADQANSHLKFAKNPHGFWWNILLGSSKCHICLTLNSQKNYIGCEIYIPEDKSVFRKLVSKKDEIENELGEELTWQELPNAIASRIILTYDANSKDRSKWVEYYEWMIATAEDFFEVFSKYVTDVNKSKNIIKRFDDYAENNLTFVDAAQLILRENGNKPMTPREIWDQIHQRKLVKFEGSTPWATLNSRMGSHCGGSGHKKKFGNIFKIFSENPRRYVLVDDSDILHVEDDGFESEDQNSQEPVVNKFATALLVIGDSGAGKSTLIDSLLEKENHEFEFIIPTATTTSLLAQFQSSKSKYVISRLGKLILEAVDNPNREYTAVFDEMHKSIVIEMVNDELLQAISLERNEGRRFISVDGEISSLYKDKLDDLNIPQNFGFIFITSKPKILNKNPDLIRRVRVVEINEGDSSKINTIDDLLNLSIPGKDYEPRV